MRSSDRDQRSASSVILKSTNDFARDQAHSGQAPRRVSIFPPPSWRVCSLQKNWLTCAGASFFLNSLQEDLQTHAKG
jgi:hypothetical protein